MELTDKENKREVTEEDVTIIRAIHRGIQWLFHNAPENYNDDEKLLTLKGARYHDPETGYDLVLTGSHQEALIDGKSFAISEFTEGTTINGVPHTYFCKTISDEVKQERISRHTVLDGYTLV